MVMDTTLETWRRKLNYLQQQDAVLADPAQKFALAEQMTEAKNKISEIEANPVT